MSKKENSNRRGNDEGDNAFKTEKEALGISDIAEKTIATTIHTGLKIAEAKEKLIVSKDNTRLQTDRKITNFHREKRNNRFQVDRLSALEDGGVDNEYTENNNSDDGETAENNSVEAEISELSENNSTEEKEVDSDSEDKARSKKNIQRKMRERVKEQRKRSFTEERQDTKNSQSRFYNDDFTDFEDYNGYVNSNGYADYADAPPSKPTTENNTHIDSSYSDDTNKDKAKNKANRKDDIGKPYKADTSNKSSKLNSNAKPLGLKHDKGEVKLKTDKKDSLDITLNRDENRLDKKQVKLRKRQRNNLVNKKYNLKNARLAHATATSKLIINKGEENNQSPIYNLQDNTYTKQCEDYARQEQESLNKNVVNTASSGLKSVIADFEAFEANLSSKDDVKTLQKKFNKKKQQKAQRLKKKAEKTEERKSNNLKLKNEALALQDEKANKLKHENLNSKDSYILNNTDIGKNNALEYNLKNREKDDTLNKRDSSESTTPITKKNNNKSVNPLAEKNHYTYGDSNTSKNADKSVNVSSKAQHKSESLSSAKRSSNRNTAIDTNKRNDNSNVASTDNRKNGSAQNTPTDNKNNTNSRLKHDKTLHNRKSDAKAITGERLKFKKENISWHEQREEKLKHSQNKVKSKENANTSSVSITNKEQQKSLQKRHNRKSLQKKAIKNKKGLSENTLQFGKKAGKATARQTLEAIKFLARLMLQKIVALVLFVISKIAIISVLIMIPVIVIALIGVVFLGTTGTMILTSYLADDETLSQVSVYYSDKERDLRNSLTESVIIEAYDVDEVNYVLVDNIGHNSHFLLSYLTAKYQTFTFEQIQSELDTIFSLQYTKNITVREVNVPILDPDGEPTGEFETRRIADVTLTNNGFYDILYAKLTDSEREHFLLLLETTGNRQYGGFPMSWDWLINITEDFNNLNNGVEAEVPVSTAVYGTINGEIVNITADSVSIQGTTGNDTIIITFSRLNNVVVSVGDTVQMTTVVGYTSDKIFIQVQRNGTYVNPILFLGSQQQDLVYGTIIPPLTQSEFNTLSSFASTALGTPYVFGGTGPPPRGIDCSGFIWWAYNGSGIKSWGRTTAQGQFNQCDPITFADARPGDLIFFQGTYDTQDSRVVTHVGIYLGHGQMQHSGTPNEITSINSAYWQNHFYSFGRLRR